jgi:REP element-mobilizing transposase RayT
MPRQQRQKSESGIYHVMLRGINRLQLFYDDDDRLAFVERLARYKEQCGFSLLAWCLMGNHVHLLIEEGKTELSAVMKKLELSYANYYSTKYDWKGYLYLDRFQSKPVDSDNYLLAVIRYIHRNPLEVGKAVSFWTSYNDYITSLGITDTAMVLEMLEPDKKKQREAFVELIDSQSEHSFSFVDSINSKQISDEKALALILEISGLSAPFELYQIEKENRDFIISKLRGAGLSIRQIARLTGIGRSIVEMARPRKH